MDGSYVLESCKGDRSLQERRLPRAQGGNRGRRGRGSEQRPILTAVSRGGPTYAEAIPSTAMADIAPVMSAWLAEDCAVVGRHRWPLQLSSGKPKPELSSGNGARQPTRVSSRELASEYRQPASHDHEAVAEPITIVASLRATWIITCAG